MIITTPNGILEGDSIEAIIAKNGKDCLCGAILCGAILCGADLRGADLRGAKSISELTIAKTSILPDEGDVIGWKKALGENDSQVIVKLRIPSDAQRSNSTAQMPCQQSRSARHSRHGWQQSQRRHCS